MKPTIHLLWLFLFATIVNAAELPVREVVLYKHGVGHFRRSGQLQPGESARLDFKASEMNDVLKSLMIREQGGGQISGLRYDSSEPLERKLSEFPFRLGPGQPLSAMLDQLKGAIVELQFASDTVRGAIVSGRVVPGNETRPQSEQITLLLDSGELRNFDLAAAASIRFTEASLQTQFRDYLAALVGARSKEKRSVYIDSTGSATRQIVADYMIPMPVWKSSYRLIFDQGGDSGDPTLEGWAIVDNTTGEDWTNVSLALVSGRPISFVSRLYEPRYIQRPVAELPGEMAQAPVIYGGAIEMEEDLQENRTAAAKSAVMADRRLRAEMAAPQSLPAPGEMGIVGGVYPARRVDALSSIAVTAATRELGELFEYRFSTPVTVRKSESAMLPFLQQKVEARKLLVYSGGNSIHPMNAAEITNSTGKTLDGGPITVYESNAYAGEALMETLKAGDKRLISYGVDLGTRITTQFDSKAEVVREIHLRRGILTTRTAAVETKTFTIRNVDQEPKTLIIEHPVRPQYKLLNLKPTETTANAYRFQVSLPAGATEKFPVTEERVYQRTFEIANLTPEILLTYIQNKDLSLDARTQLEQIVDQKRQIAENAAELQRTEAEINTVVQDQGRIRQNINSLNRVRGQEQQVQAYARQLAAQEIRLASLRDHSSELQRRQTVLQSELNFLIERMEF
ncbi:MAG: hypothetical protein IH846_11525 [Acidobacteria bacterium]|nr:hypothetical protein [Acidobacteriota bacterium]